MIRKAEIEDISALSPVSEAAVRILGLAAAYGVDCGFLRFWCDRNRNLYISLSDSHAVICADKNADWQELWLFLSMQPEIESVRTCEYAAQRLAELGGWRYNKGVVMTPGTDLHTPRLSPERLEPRDVYALLDNCFEQGLPAYRAWYADVSHRMRHGLCRIVGLTLDSTLASCAMTTAECETAAIIGAVGTLPIARGRGLASDNVLTLANELAGEDKKVILSPKNRDALRLYSRIGFVPCGEWAELYRKDMDKA